MAPLQEDVLRAARRLARINPLTPEVITNSEDVSVLQTSNRKRTLKAMVHAADGFRDHGNFGRLRSTLLMGTTLLGDEFLFQVESAGTLLADIRSTQSFGKFLRGLAAETANAKVPVWAVLHNRLRTYSNFQQLVETLARKTVDVSHFLRDSPRRLVKLALAVAELAFLREHFSFEVPKEYSDLIDELGTPEKVASVASLLVVFANEHHPLDSLDFAFPGASGLRIGELRELMIYGEAMVQQFEIGKYISLFRYELDSLPGPTFVLRPPFAEFEYFSRLGFIRSEMSGGAARTDVASKHKGSVLSLRVAAEKFAAAHDAKLAEVRDKNTEWRRLRLNFPSIPSLYNSIKDEVFYEDLIVDEQLSKEFLMPLRYLNEHEIKLTEHLDLKTFRRAWRYLEFLSLVDIALRRPYAKNDPTVLLNSIVRAADEEQMVDLVAGLGLSDDQAREFVSLMSADLRRQLGYLDLQYRPALRIAQTFNPQEGRLTKPEIVFLPALIVTSNVARNLQSENKLRFELNAEAFVDLVAQTFRSTFSKVETSKPLKGLKGPEGKTEATDVDLVVLEGNTLYLFECKHSLPPTGPHEIRDIWEDIEKGISQLATAMKILGDPVRRQSYLTGWFPCTKPQDTADLKLVACVLCSDRIFSGLHYRGFPIRDFSSLQLLFQGGIVGMGGPVSEDEVVMRQYRIMRDKTMSGSDLGDYCSPDSMFFNMFRPFMSPLSRIERLEGITIAEETFVYQVELNDWANHMEALGCTREPDRRQRLKPGSREGVLEQKEGS
jgi:hypothetical protein